MAPSSRSSTQVRIDSFASGVASNRRSRSRYCSSVRRFPHTAAVSRLRSSISAPVAARTRSSTRRSLLVFACVRISDEVLLAREQQRESRVVPLHVARELVVRLSREARRKLSVLHGRVEDVAI